jgi:5-oxoprolinase (ATP-hydrolysing)
VVATKFAALAKQTGQSAEDVADGFIRIAVENMANAIRRISVAKGYDARDYVLNCFGGAGGQHACLVADALGMTRIFIHPFSGVLSAYGMKLASLRALRQRAVGQKLDAALMASLAQTGGELARAAEAEIKAQGAVATHAIQRVHIRYEGSDTTLPIALTSLDAMSSTFAEQHARLFGFGFEGKGLIAESIEVEATDFPPPFYGGGGAREARDEGGGGAFEGAASPSASLRSAPPPQSRGGKFFSQGTWHDASLYKVRDLATGAVITGPALLIEPHQTIVVEPGWRAEIREDHSLVLTRDAAAKAAINATTEADPVSLEVFANLFMAIAEEMGATLQNTASSVNIKERLDFSCAIFDADGGLVANAPHMPVHLGSMGDCVTAIMKKHPAMRDGDMFVTNAPYDGGTHLPDITVVAPVFVDGAARG